MLAAERRCRESLLSSPGGRQEQGCLVQAEGWRPAQEGPGLGCHRRRLPEGFRFHNGRRDVEGGGGDRPQSHDSAGLAAQGSSLSPGSRDAHSAFSIFQANHCLKGGGGGGGGRSDLSKTHSEARCRPTASKS